MKKALNVLLILVVLGVGAAAAHRFIRTRPKPARKPRSAKPPIVDVIRARRSAHTVVVEAMGTVIAAQEVTLRPQVSGLIVEQSPHLVPGGLLKKGEVVARIDPRDHELAVEREKGNVERAQFQLTLEESRQVIAEREWRLLGSDARADEAGRDLALRKPHVRNARAALAAARSSLQLAQINVARSTARAPFNALIQEEFIDTGQLATPQTPLARLIGTDHFRVRVSLAVDKLSLIRIPAVDGCKDDAGAAATIVQLANQGQRIERQARVIRLLGDLEPRGRMARLLLQVKDPLGLESGSGLPLLVGAYVRAEIQARTLKDVCRLPRRALHAGDEIWVAEKQSARTVLRIRRDIDIAYRARDYILVRKGVEDGERVVVSRLGRPADGKVIRTHAADGDRRSEARPRPHGATSAREHVDE